MTFKFKKTCFECGEKTEKLINNKCESCFKQSNPPIEDIKAINLKICNKCKKIFYNNQLLEVEEIKKRLPNIVKKHLIIDKQYNLKTINTEKFKIEGSKVSFDIDIDCDIKE